MRFENRVYGAVGISSVNANWNADFTGRPKSLSTGEIFGSDKALKYSIKKMWENEGQKVMYIKSYKDTKGKLQPLGLNERYSKLFNTELSDKTESKVVLKNLFSAMDVMNFGATFAVSVKNKDDKKSISITGAVQVMQGMNLYEETEIEIQDILSPFANPYKDETIATSLGKKITVNEAHYLYGFSVNPQNYDIYNDIIDDFEGYTEEAYNNFKRGCLLGATALNTNSKSGCENEFAVFIKFKKESKAYIPNVAEYIKFSKSEKNIYDLSELGEFIERYSADIESVEVYCNKFKVDVICGKLNCEVKDIYD